MKSFEEIYSLVEKKNHTLLNEIQNERNEMKKGYRQLKLKFFLYFLALIFCSVIIGISNSTTIPFQEYIIPIARILLILLCAFPGIYILYLFLYILFLKEKEPEKKQIDYNKLYKDNIIKSFIDEYDYHLTYHSYETYKYNNDPNSYIPESLYQQAEFIDTYDRYYSEDLITGKINGLIAIQLGDIVTTNVSRDTETHLSTEYPVFKGLFSCSTCSKDIQTSIYIRNGKWSQKDWKNKKLLEFPEISDTFSVFAEDEALARKILSSEFLEKILSFYQNDSSKLDLTIKQNQLYVRFPCSDTFEISYFEKRNDYELLKEYYTNLDSIIQINKALYELLKE